MTFNIASELNAIVFEYAGNVAPVAIDIEAEMDALIAEFGGAQLGRAVHTVRCNRTGALVARAYSLNEARETARAWNVKAEACRYVAA